MEWRPFVGGSSEPFLIIVHNDPMIAEATGRLSGVPYLVLVTSASDRLAAILEMLHSQSGRASSLYIPANLIYQGSQYPSDNGGIELLKHLRLTTHLELLARMPVIIGLDGLVRDYVHQSADNIFLLAPGCLTVPLIVTPAEFRSHLSHLPSFTDLEQMQRALVPFVIFTDADERRRMHAYLNTAGVGKLLEEFADTVLPHDHSVREQCRSAMQDELWLKKLYLRNPELRPQASVDRERSAELWQICRERDYRFLMIDDQHRRGWSDVLYTGLTGNSADPPLQSLTGGKVESCDGRMLCIDNYSQASELVKELRLAYESALDRCVKALNQVQFKQASCVRHRLKMTQLAEQLKVLPPGGDSSNVRRMLADEDNNLTAAEAKLNTTRSQFVDMWQRLNAANPYRIIFLDLRLDAADESNQNLEELTGVRLVREIKQAFPALPVIVITASEMAVTAETVKNLGVEAYWVKGRSDGETLLKAIEQCLRMVELRPLWYTLRLVEEMAAVLAFEWDGSDRANSKYKGRYLPLDNSILKLPQEEYERRVADRNAIMQWLRESFQLLWEAGPPCNHFSVTYPDDKVVLNMTIIQELRYRGLNIAAKGRKDQALEFEGVTDIVGDSAFPAIKMEERVLRKSRLGIVHGHISRRKNKGTNLKLGHRYDRRQALRFFVFTLNRLANLTLLSEIAGTSRKYLFTDSDIYDSVAPSS